mmetsp:Transcript_15289/g.39326  ORF Transcript_15289/g.39326 Transcript_15289/m.39326 type:complete len:82 (-) Transcript_15289:1427-1672(-)
MDRLAVGRTAGTAAPSMTPFRAAQAAQVQHGVSDDLHELFRVAGLHISPEIFSTVLELVRLGHQPDNIVKMIKVVMDAKAV